MERPLRTGCTSGNSPIEDNIVESVETGEVSEAHINERRLLMRIDLRLLPCLVTMYLITFLDRYMLQCFHLLLGY